MNVQGGHVEGSNLGVSGNVVNSLDEPEEPEYDHHNEHEPKPHTDVVHALTHRVNDVRQMGLLDHRVVALVADDLLILKQRAVVDTLKHEHAKQGEEYDLKQVEDLEENKRRHAVILVVLVDTGEELVQVVDMTPSGF